MVVHMLSSSVQPPRACTLQGPDWGWGYLGPRSKRTQHQRAPTWVWDRWLPSREIKRCSGGGRVLGTAGEGRVRSA